MGKIIVSGLGIVLIFILSCFVLVDANTMIDDFSDSSEWILNPAPGLV